MTAKPAQPHRLEHLDAIRGLAALAVVCSHYVSAYGVPYAPRVIMETPLRAWADGAAAVSMFFVLSGLVLSIRHFRHDSRPRLIDFSYAGFLVSRVCRIGLPYWTVLLVSVGLWRYSAIHVHGGPPVTPWSQELWQRAPSLATVATDANLLHLDRRYAFVPQAWTLAIEIVVSALVPAGILVAAGGTGWLIGVTLLACFAGHLDLYALHFAVGILLAKHYHAIAHWLQPRLPVRVVLGLAGWVFYSYGYLAPRSPWMHYRCTDLLMSGLGSAMLLMTFSSSPGVRAWLSRGLAKQIGRSSYSLYLSHFLVLLCVTPRLMAYMVSGHHPKVPWIGSWTIGLLSTILLAVLLAEAIYWAVEVPSIAIGKRVAAGVTSILPCATPSRDHTPESKPI